MAKHEVKFESQSRRIDNILKVLNGYGIASIEEAEAFLEDCMAAVVDSLDEVIEYFDENGMDISDMSEEEIEDASEVFALPSGRYLIVEG